MHPGAVGNFRKIQTHPVLEFRKTGTHFQWAKKQNEPTVRNLRA
jgi:hypothetical protein